MAIICVALFSSPGSQLYPHFTFNFFYDESFLFKYKIVEHENLHPSKIWFLGIIVDYLSMGENLLPYFNCFFVLFSKYEFLKVFQDQSSIRTEEIEPS